MRHNMDLVYIRPSGGVWKVGDLAHQKALRAFKEMGVAGPIMVYLDGEGDVRWWRVNPVVYHYELANGRRMSVMTG